MIAGDPAMTDLELIGLVASSDTSALGHLYDRHRTAAFGLAIRVTRDRALAEDVVHDAFLGVWRNAHSFRAGRGSVRTWILAIVHHRGVDVVRKRRPVEEIPLAALPAGLVTPDIWREVSAHLDRDTVRDALRALGPDQREAIELAYFAGLTQAEIASRTGTPLGTAKSRVRLGLLAMRGVIPPEAVTGSIPARTVPDSAPDPSRGRSSRTSPARRVPR